MVPWQNMSVMSIILVALTKKGQEWKRILEIESIVKSGASLKCGQVSWVMQVLRDLKSSLSKENICCCWRPTSRKENTCTAWLWSSWLCLGGQSRSGKWKPELAWVCKREKNKMWKDKHSECAQIAQPSPIRNLVHSCFSKQGQRKHKPPWLKMSLFCTFSFWLLIFSSKTNLTF